MNLRIIQSPVLLKIFILFFVLLALIFSFGIFSDRVNAQEICDIICTGEIVDYPDGSWTCSNPSDIEYVYCDEEPTEDPGGGGGGGGGGGCVTFCNNFCGESDGCGGVCGNSCGGGCPDASAPGMCGNCDPNIPYPEAGSCFVDPLFCDSPDNNFPAPDNDLANCNYCEPGGTFAPNNDPNQCPAMSGILTASNCIIASGASSCNSNIDWSVTNPESPGGSAVTTPTNTTVGTGDSGSTTYPVSFGTRYFFLYNNAEELAQAPATASCSPGTVWNSTSGVCEGMSGTLTPETSSCVIAEGDYYCNINFSWSVTNPQNPGGSAVTRPVNVTVGSGDSGSNVAFPVPHNSQTFYLYNNGELLAEETVLSNCVAGTEFVGGKCSAIVPPPPMSGTLTPASSFCTILEGQSSCNINFSWSVTNPQNPGGSAVTRPVSTTVATGDSGSNVPLAVKYNFQTFSLYNNTQLLAQSNVFSDCTLGTSWNGSSCVIGNPPPPPPPDGDPCDPEEDVICAEPNPINPSGTTTIIWNCPAGATSSYSPDFETEGLTDGSVELTPASTTTYTVICNDSGGTVGEVTVVVRRIPIFIEN